MEPNSSSSLSPIIMRPLHEKDEQLISSPGDRDVDSIKNSIDKCDYSFESATSSSVSSFSDGETELDPLYPSTPPNDSEVSTALSSPDTKDNIDNYQSDSKNDFYAEHKCPYAGCSSQCRHSRYGHPLSPESVKKSMPLGNGGLQFHVKIVPDDICKEGKLRFLKQREFDFERKSIKPRRATLPVKASDFFSSLVRIDDDDESSRSRWIFTGVLNGWPGLTCLELIDLRVCRLPSLWSSMWSVDKEGQRGILPHVPRRGTVVRATLRGAPWSSNGWCAESPGFVFWFESQRITLPRVTYGSNIVQQAEVEGNIPLCTRVHMISHRYAHDRPETRRDKLTYHSVVLLEWDHGRYSTVVELAYQNGMGGAGGKCNWIEDRDEAVPSLYRAFPPEMIMPWNDKASEIRCIDVPATNLEEFKIFVHKHTGPKRRFLDPHFTFSHPVRLTFRSKAHIAQYLLNYIGRDWTYSEMRRNCQTFAADLCGFLAGKRGIEPFHPVNRIEYKNRSYYFLYESNMYDTASS